MLTHELLRLENLSSQFQTREKMVFQLFDAKVFVTGLAFSSDIYALSLQYAQGSRKAIIGLIVVLQFTQFEYLSALFLICSQIKIARDKNLVNTN